MVSSLCTCGLVVFVLIIPFYMLVCYLIGIESWSFVQKLGDAVFIPAGCPHQVRNLKVRNNWKWIPSVFIVFLLVDCHASLQSFNFDNLNKSS